MAFWIAALLGAAAISGTAIIGYQVFFACRQSSYVVADEWPLEEVAQKGALFNDSNNTILVYALRNGCLELHRWDKAEGRSFKRHEGEAFKNLYLRFSRDWEVVARGDCSASADELPRQLALSADGHRLAWIWRKDETGDIGSLRLYVAILPDSSAPTTIRGSEYETPLSLPAEELAFVDNDTLMIRSPLDQTFLWDCVNERETMHFATGSGTDFVSIWGRQAASASRRSVCISALNNAPVCLPVVRMHPSQGEARARPQVSSTEERQPQDDLLNGEGDSNEARITALGFGEARVAAIGSSRGTYALLKLRNGSLEHLVQERRIEEVTGPITHAVWLKKDTLLLGGRFTGLYLVPISFRGQEEDIIAGEPYPLQLKWGAEPVEWITSNGELVVYGNTGRVTAGFLRKRCERGDPNRVLVLTTQMVTLLAFIATLVGLLRRSRRGTILPHKSAG